jgi:hypothetical protein
MHGLQWKFGPEDYKRAMDGSAECPTLLDQVLAAV